MRLFNERQQQERRSQWAQFHEDMRRLHTRLADEHMAKREKLLEGEGGS